MIYCKHSRFALLYYRSTSFTIEKPTDHGYHTAWNPRGGVDREEEGGISFYACPSGLDMNSSSIPGRMSIPSFWTTCRKPKVRARTRVFSTRRCTPRNRSGRYRTWRVNVLS